VAVSEDAGEAEGLAGVAKGASVDVVGLKAVAEACEGEGEASSACRLLRRSRRPWLVGEGWPMSRSLGHDTKRLCEETIVSAGLTKAELVARQM